MFGRSWKIGRIAGIEIRADVSWTIIVLLVWYSLSGYFDATYPSLSAVGALGLGLLAAVLFFGSVLLHELAHALVSRARKIPVEGITLFLFGGATHAKVDAREPRDELLITAAGPATSAILTVVYWGLALLSRGRIADSVAGMFGYLAWINLALTVFNLLPGFPLDGGRILRATVWRATGDLDRATRVAAAGGVVVGYTMAGIGVVMLLGGALGSGIWLGAIGWFLAMVARSSGLEQEARGMLRNETAGSLMTRDLVSIPAETSLHDAVDHYFLRYDHSAFPVTAQGRTVGLLTLRTVKATPRDTWPHRTAGDVMHPLDRRYVVPPDMDMEHVLDRLHELHRVIVVDHDEVVGMITPTDVAGWVRRHHDLGRAA